MARICNASTGWRTRRASAVFVVSGKRGNIACDPSEDAHMTEQPTGTQAENASSEGQAPEQPVRQLDAIIENLTTYAVPVLREITARAAELAVKAGQAAGPIAYKAAEVTEGIGERVADRSREIATELRRDSASVSSASADDEPAGDQSHVGPPGDTGEAWADTRAGSIIDPPSSSSAAATFIDAPR
jgi:hypothetical protein